MSKKIARSLAAQFTQQNPCCVRVVPYENGGEDTEPLTMCVYVHTDYQGIPEEVKKSAKEMFGGYKIEYVDLQRRPLSGIVLRHPSCKKQKQEELSDLTRKIEENLHFFENRLNVTAVQATYKVAKCIEEDIPCVTVFVVGKGRIPAWETEIMQIKEDHDVFHDVKFDVVEGYYRPAVYSPFPSEVRAYAGVLRGGVGIGVRNVNAAGTLGAFVEDEQGVRYILSNEHVLNPPEVISNSTAHIIEQPAKIDYDDKLRTDQDNLQQCKEKEKFMNPYSAKPLTEADIEDIKGDDYFGRLWERNQRHIKKAEDVLEETQMEEPRLIGTYVDGMKDNVKKTLDGNTYRIYVDVAIAKLDEKELNIVKKDGDRPKGPLYENYPLYGFTYIKKIIPSGETIDLENGVKEIREQDPHEPETQLTFLKIGRETGLTDEGRIDSSIEKLFVHHVEAAKLKTPCSPLCHVEFPYEEECIPPAIKDKVIRREPDGVQVCSNCSSNFNSCEVYSFWKHNCFVIRKDTKFCDEGDSGSVIFDDRGRAWALLHGVFRYSTHLLCLASPLSVALEALGQKCAKKLKLW
jgi:hypothetical protein